jgi:hypothetical protein
MFKYKPLSRRGYVYSIGFIRDKSVLHHLWRVLNPEQECRH